MANEFTYRRQDADLIETKTLAAAGATPANGGSIDLGATPAQDSRLAGCELEIGSPVLDATQLPNGETMIYKVEDSADDTTFNDVADLVLTVTGAGGVGAAATTERFRLPSTIRRYIRVVATTSAGTGNCSASSFTTKLLT